MRAARFAALLLLLNASSRVARAKPQFNLALLPGAAFSPDKPHVAFSGRLHSDVLFGRTSSSSFGVGPALDIGTYAFRDLRLAPALSVQLPSDPVSLVLSLGPLCRFEPKPYLGGSLRLFVGSRAFNHFSTYSPALGLDLSLEATRGPLPQYFAAASAHIDLEWLSLPALIAINWFRGSNR